MHIALKTEYSFKASFLHIGDIHKYVVDGCVGIADLNNTFGHIPLKKESEKHGFRPIYGVRLYVLPDSSKQRTCNVSWIFIAKNNAGLRELYKLVEKAYDQFYYIPRLNTSDLSKISENIFIIAPDYTEKDYDYIAVGQGYRNMAPDDNVVLVDNNYYPTLQDGSVYELLAGARKHGDSYINLFESQVWPQHILTNDEKKVYFPDYYLRGNAAAKSIAAACDADIPKAEMVRWNGDHDIEKRCRKGQWKVEDWTQEYEDRLVYELNLIGEKDYVDYFLIVADLISNAKRRMLVGPSRGSSAGSLVCYLLGITEVDPIEHKLIFERFIDVNRFDLPDIDIDFPDTKRESVIKYLKSKYGHEHVACLANINRLKAKSAIGEFAKALGIPPYETDAVKDAIIERSGGDARAAMCIADTFETTEPGKDFISKYPAMELVSRVEGHASHAGRHAAGILVSTLRLDRYGAINDRDGIIMMDKKDAEYLDLLKIDVLGLRTLSILEEVAEQLGKPYDWFYTLPLDNPDTYKLFNNMRLTGIFQFEGQALNHIVKKMGVHNFNDISAITALARPGALNSGGTSRYIKYATGAEEPTYYSDIHHSITGDTYGIVVYQEQMMEIARKVGGLSWKDTSMLRRAASKSMGDEFFGQYKERFIEGALKNGYSEEDSAQLWVDISASGSWSFNKSHAVSYGLVSYWTAYCKANYPAEFAVACLNHSSDTGNAIKLLRDLVTNEGFSYTPVDSDLSGLAWTQHDGVLVGGLTNVNGIGVVKARQIIKAREGKAKWTPSMMKLLMNPKTPFDVIFPAKHYFGFLYNDPVSHGLDTRPHQIDDVDGKGEYVIIGRLMSRNLRDLNEHVFVQKRGGALVDADNLYLNFRVEDDSGQISCKIDRYLYSGIGKPIVESGKIDHTWYLMRGRIRSEWRILEVTEVVNLNDYYKLEI